MSDDRDASPHQHDVFLVGAPRSGTTWVQAVLSAHPSFVSPAETNIFDLLSNAQKTFEAGRAEGLGPSWVVRQADFDSWCGQLWNELRSGLLANSATATRVLEKTPDHIMYMDLMRHLVPNARFIHLVRHPVDVVRSTLEAAPTWASSWAPSTVEGATVYWGQRVEAGLASAHPDDTLLVRYEDLRASPENWRTLLDFIGIESTWALPDVTLPPAELLSPARLRGADDADQLAAFATILGASFHGRPADTQRELADFEQRYVEKHSTSLMTQLGYEPRSGSITMLDHVRIVVRGARRRIRRAGRVILHG